MKPKLLAALASFCLAAGFIAACSSVGGSNGPTVAVLVDSIPTNTRVYVDDIRAGESPIKVNLLVDEFGKLAYDVDITADFSASHVAQSLGRPGEGFKSQNEPVFLRLKKGEVPPAQINFSNGMGTRRGEVAKLNPPGTRSTAPGRVGDRDPIQSMLNVEADESAPTVAPAASAPAGLNTGGGGGGRGGN